MTIYSKESLCSAANILIGGDPISDLDDGTREAEVFSNLFDITFESLLSSTNWNFAQRDIQLSIESTPSPDKLFKYSAKLPLDFMRLVKLYSTSGIIINNFDISGDGTTIFLNEKEIFMKYMFKPKLFNLPGYFAETLTYKLASAAAEPLSGEGSLFDRITQRYLQLEKAAGIRDSSQDSKKSYWTKSSAVVGVRK